MAEYGEIRLLGACLLNGAVLWSAGRFARRRCGGGMGQQIGDALLIYFLVCYAAVGVCGVVGALRPGWIAAAALAACAGLVAGSRGRPPAVAQAAEHGPRGWQCWGVVATCLGSAGVLIAVAYVLSLGPVLAEDALTYHFPAAAHWLQTGRITLWETWFFNPANTYSPLAGSALIAWWMAPMGSDVLARLVQLPALVMVFVLMIELCRELKAGAATAALVAAATIFARPFITEAIYPKDDLFVAAFFLAAVVGCAPGRLGGAMGAWRVGAALGLMVATKYTALLSVPVFLVLLVRPRACSWVAVGKIVAAVVVLAGPWFLRNAVLTGNPVYPIDVRIGSWTIFGGMFTAARSLELGSGAGIWRTMVSNDHALPGMLWILLGCGYAAAWAAWGKSGWTEPLRRGCLLGPVLGLGLFVLVSPYAELRFELPALALLFACVAGGAAKWLGEAAPAVGVAVAAASLGTWLAGVGTEFTLTVAQVAVPLTIVGLVVAMWREALGRLGWGAYAGAGAGAGLILAGVVYVEWPNYVHNVLPGNEAILWRASYPDANAWVFVRDHVPADAVIAYANTHTVYPLMGAGLKRRVVYVPTRKGVEHLTDLPHFPGAIAGEKMQETMTAALREDPDEFAWLARLERLGVQYLYVHRNAGGAEAPEEAWAGKNRWVFVKVFEDRAAVVYELVRGGEPTPTVSRGAGSRGGDG